MAKLIRRVSTETVVAAAERDMHTETWDPRDAFKDARRLATAREQRMATGNRRHGRSA